MADMPEASLFLELKKAYLVNEPHYKKTAKEIENKFFHRAFVPSQFLIESKNNLEFLNEELLFFRWQLLFFMRNLPEVDREIMQLSQKRTDLSIFLQLMKADSLCSQTKIREGQEILDTIKIGPNLFYNYLRKFVEIRLSRIFDRKRAQVLVSELVSDQEVKKQPIVLQLFCSRHVYALGFDEQNKSIIATGINWIREIIESLPSNFFKIFHIHVEFNLLRSVGKGRDLVDVALTNALEASDLGLSVLSSPYLVTITDLYATEGLYVKAMNLLSRFSRDYSKGIIAGDYLLVSSDFEVYSATNQFDKIAKICSQLLLNQESRDNREFLTYVREVASLQSGVDLSQALIKADLAYEKSLKNINPTDFFTWRYVFSQLLRFSYFSFKPNHFIENALNESKNSSHADTRLLTEVKSIVGECFLVHDDIPRAREILLEALDAAVARGATACEVRTLCLLSLIEIHEGGIALGRARLERARHLAETVDYQESFGAIQAGLAISWLLEQDEKEAELCWAELPLQSPYQYVRLKLNPKGIKGVAPKLTQAAEKYFEKLFGALIEKVNTLKAGRVKSTEVPSGKSDFDLVLDLGVNQIKSGKYSFDIADKPMVYTVLEFMVRNQGAVFSKEELVEKIWKEKYNPLIHDTRVYTTVKRLRELLSKQLRITSKTELLIQQKGKYGLSSAIRAKVVG